MTTIHDISHFSMQKQYITLFFLLPILFFCPNYAHATGFFYLTTSNISIEKESINLDLYLSITQMDEVEKMLKSGASIEITCDTNLLRKQSLLTNPSIESLALVWLLQYDPLTREFLLYANNKIIKRERDFNGIIDSIFFPLSLALNNARLEQKIAYSIDLQLRLRQTKIPSWIEKTLFFWNWDIMATRYTFDFVLPENYKEIVLNKNILDSIGGDDV